MNKIITTTTQEIPGKKIAKILGVVKGNTIRARHVGRDIAAGFKNIVGGEIKSYTEMTTQAREEAFNRMVNEAHDLGADAIISVRFTTSMIMQGASEMLAYGTAVKIKQIGYVTNRAEMLAYGTAVKIKQIGYVTNRAEMLAYGTAVKIK